MTPADDSKIGRHLRIGRIFTPSTPIRSKDLFAGRLDQVIQVLTALQQPGLQIVIYGERGVGKSSLANVLSQFFRADVSENRPAIRINCDTGDTFKSVWQKVLRSASIPIPDSWAYGSPDPDEIRLIMESLPSPFVILDEFDRWENDEGLSAMADTVKALSDHAVETKIVIVGVADSIDQLIGEHESVRRAIEEVQLPRMTTTELLEIPMSGFRQLDMTISADAAHAIAVLAEGLPHFAHLLSLHAGQRSVADDRANVTLADVQSAIKLALKRHSVLRAYQTAVAAQRKDTLHARVLLACALAEKDPLGFFTASSVRGPMSDIMGRPYSIPAFAPHLKAFTEPERGAALKREGFERRYRYRFRDPLLQPFTILTAMADGWLPAKYKDGFFSKGT